MPPVREASTKPSAATVLPAPVACSNQKRRAAPGSSSMRVGGRLLLGLLGRVPVERLLVGQLVALELDLAGVELLESRRSPVAVAADLELGLERDQRAGQRVHLVGRQRRAVGQVRLLLGEQPLEPEHQRELAPPLERRLVAARVDLRQRSVERARAGRVLSASAVRGVLALEHEGFTREFLGALQVVAGNRRGIGHGASLSHESGVLRLGRDVPSCSSGDSGVRPWCAAVLLSPASNDGPGPVRDAWRIPIEAHRETKWGHGGLCHPSRRASADRPPAARRGPRRMLVGRHHAVRATSSAAASTRSRRRSTASAASRWS